MSASFSASETGTVGADPGSAVSEKHPAGANRFTGTIDWVQIDAGDVDAEHRARQRANRYASRAGPSRPPSREYS